MSGDLVADLMREHSAEVEQLRSDRRMLSDALTELIAALEGLGKEKGGGARLAAALVDAHMALEATKNEDASSEA